MVSLASSSSQQCSPAQNSLKLPLILDRQQPLRSSKKFKRQELDSNRESPLRDASDEASKLKAKSSSMTCPPEGNQLLACYEDSSFIYNRVPKTSVDSLSSPSSASSCSSSLFDCLWSSSEAGTSLAGESRNGSGRASSSSGQFSTGSPSCLSAFDYCHLSSYKQPPAPANKPQARHPQPPRSALQQQQQFTTRHAPDPVFTERAGLLESLVARERAEIRRREFALAQMGRGKQPAGEAPLGGQLRHSLLSWMLKVCEQQLCQDEIFPLASMILDKFLLFQPEVLPAVERETVAAPEGAVERAAEMIDLRGEGEDSLGEQFLCNEQELHLRQLYLFAACALLLATKLRQTPRLCVQSLIESSRSELPVELNRDEILDGELLILATLKWDLAALITPNDFLGALLNSCGHLMSAEAAWKKADKCDQSRVMRHTQTLVELCLMDSKLSQIAPSVLAMTSMAVAIDGLSMTEKSCWRLKDIVKEIYKSTHNVNELKQMIDIAFQIEKYVQKLLNYTKDV